MKVNGKDGTELMADQRKNESNNMKRKRNLVT